MEEKRKSKRFRIDESITVNHIISAEGLDVSEDGIYVYTRHTMVPRSIIELRINILGEPVVITARVEHSQPGIGFGASFQDLSPEAAGKIQNWLEGMG